MSKPKVSCIDYVRSMLENLSEKAASVNELQLTAYILQMAAAEAADFQQKTLSLQAKYHHGRRPEVTRSATSTVHSPPTPPNRWDTICLLQEMLEVLRPLAVAERADMLVFLIDQAILDIREILAGKPRPIKNIGEVIERAPPLTKVGT